jgi:hypothetical protein
MYAQQVGQQMPVADGAAPFVNEMGQPIPAAPSMDAFMAGSQMQAPYMQQQMMGEPSPASFVEQPQYAQTQAQAAAPYFNTQESNEVEEEAEVADESESEETESEETEDSEEESNDARFQQVDSKPKKGGKEAKHAAKHHGEHRGKKHGKHGKHTKGAAHHKGKQHGKKHHDKKGKKGGKKTFTPKLGKPKNNKRSPSAKTPKSAGGRKLPPMPAPLPAAFKINCKKNPKLCIDAETPAEGEEPGDHSPKAVFKKKMEVIKKSLMLNNRNIAAESKWIDQVETIMKQYALKVKKVREHIGDERKAIKELLRQRRIILNEKKQKELEARLKMATTELTSLTDALGQVKKKEKELGSGKTQLGAKIGLLVNDLKKLRTDKQADESQALKKAD